MSIFAACTILNFYFTSRGHQAPLDQHLLQVDLALKIVISLIYLFITVSNDFRLTCTIDRYFLYLFLAGVGEIVSPDAEAVPELDPVTVIVKLLMLFIVLI